MRFMSFVQVVLLLLLAAYGVLFALENPGLTSFPLPFGRAGFTLPAGLAGLIWFLAGMGYAALLFLPVVTRQARLRRRAARARDAAEARLTSTLQARLSSVPVSPPVNVPSPVAEQVPASGGN